MASQNGSEIVREYQDRRISDSKAGLPGLDALMADARRRKFSLVLVAAFAESQPGYARLQRMIWAALANWRAAVNCARAL
jgi:hypothetical protein